MATTRGTTPIHVFTTDTDLSEAEVIYITYKQQGNVVLEKTKGDLTFDEEEISLSLTQEESLRFSSPGTVKIQIRARFADGTAIASNIVTTSVENILKDGEI